MHQIDKRQIYIDGQFIEVDCCIEKGYLMVPFLFFKHAGIFVDMNDQQSTVMFKKDKFVLILFKDRFESSFFLEGEDYIQHDSLLVEPIEKDGCLYIPFYYVAQRLGLLIWDNPINSVIYVITTSSPMSRINGYLKGETNERVVALTFDDGPDDEYMPLILDILRDKNVPATFFIIGQKLRCYQQVVKRTIEEGHSLGNHSWSHPDFAQITTTQLKKELQKTSQELFKLTGKKITILRPPYGSYTKADALLFKQLGYKNIMYSIDTHDWAGLSEEQILSIVVRDVTPGAIILQHSLKMGASYATVKALPLIIDHLKTIGYQFVPINYLLGIDT